MKVDTHIENRNYDRTTYFLKDAIVYRDKDCYYKFYYEVRNKALLVIKELYKEHKIMKRKWVLESEIKDRVNHDPKLNYHTFRTMVLVLSLVFVNMKCVFRLAGKYRIIKKISLTAEGLKLAKDIFDKEIKTSIYKDGVR